MVLTDDELARWLGELLGGEVRGLTRMTGGASRETWSFELDSRSLVLRRDPPGAPRAGAMRHETAVLRAARAVGVPVPEVITAGDHYIVMQRLAGETIARRILRDDTYDVARSRLVEQCVAAIAALHGRVPLDAVPELHAVDDLLQALRDQLDTLGEPHPAFELGLRRLESSRPPAVPPRVVHGDFRLGNWMVDERGLVGVLDWELAHLGDPVEDLGWMCVRSWRFGGAQPVAGLGSREDLLATYRAAGGGEISLASLAWWEAYGTLRWGVICVQQAATHLSGAVRSVELAAIGRRVCEVELDLLELLAPDVVRTSTREVVVDVLTTSVVHDRPTLDELVAAVQEWLAGLPLTGRDTFLARVAGRALDVVRREAALASVLAARQAERLEALGVDSATDLAAQIRAGRDDEQTVAAVCAAVVDKLRVADPRQLTGR